MIRINLLPVKQAKKRGAGQQQLALFVVALIVIGFLLYTVYDGEQQKIANLKKKEVEIQAEMARLEELIGNITSFQAKKTDLQKKLDVIEVLKKGKTGPVRILDELSTVIPKKVWLTSLVENNRNLQMAGYATDNKEIAIFMKNLETSPFFFNVTLLSIQQFDSDAVAPVPVMKFSINCDFTMPKS